MTILPTRRGTVENWRSPAPGVEWREEEQTWQGRPMTCFRWT